MVRGLRWVHKGSWAHCGCGIGSIEVRDGPLEEVWVQLVGPFEVSGNKGGLHLLHWLLHKFFILTFLCCTGPGSAC